MLRSAPYFQCIRIVSKVNKIKWFPLSCLLFLDNLIKPDTENNYIQTKLNTSTVNKREKNNYTKINVPQCGFLTECTPSDEEPEKLLTDDLRLSVQTKSTVNIRSLVPSSASLFRLGYHNLRT